MKHRTFFRFWQLMPSCIARLRVEDFMEHFKTPSAPNGFKYPNGFATNPKIDGWNVEHNGYC